MMKLLAGGVLKPDIPHPFDTTRTLFLSLDQNHLIKKLWTLLLDKEMTDGEEDINGQFMKMLFEIQQGNTSAVRPIRCLTKKKHGEPSNFDKMNVSRAVRNFSSPVIATLQYLKDNSHRHSEGRYFSDSGATICFMQNVNKWFAMHDISNRTHHVRSRNENKMQFYDMTDERLDWLDNNFLSYLSETKKACLEDGKQFLTDETYEALVHTTNSTVLCIKYLLQNGFQYILTRHFNSDPVEWFFGVLRQMSGANDMLDSRAIIISMDQLLKTGILSAPNTGNVGYNETNKPVSVWNKQSAKSKDSRNTESTCIPESTGLKNVKDKSSLDGNKHSFSKYTVSLLNRLQDVPDPEPLTLKLASIAVVAGYLVRVVEEKTSCLQCTSSISQARCSSPLLDLIYNQDRGDLRYPKLAFVQLLAIVQDFVQRAVPALPSTKVKTTIEGLNANKLSGNPLFNCAIGVEILHGTIITKIICDKFLPVILKNIAVNCTERLELHKYLNSKPLNRKILRMY